MDGKKKIIYFVPTFPVISETFIEREVSKLVQMGNLDIAVVSMAKGEGTLSHFSASITRYERLTWFNSLLAISYFVTRPSSVFKAYREIFKGFSLRNSYLFLKSMGYAKVFEKYRPDHIHVHFLSDPSTIVMIASKILAVPFSISGHAKDVFLTGTLIPEKVKAAKFVAVCNNFAYKKLLELCGNADASRIHKIYHGIDKKIFEAPASTEKPNVPMIFLGGTRLVEKKGIKYLIEASKLLVDRSVEHRVDIVGPGPLYKELLDQIKSLGLQDTVLIHGDGKGTPFSEVLEYYKIADIFVLPSIESSEGDVDGIPTVVIEAALARLPIITTNTGSISDLINSEDGIIVPQKDSKAIADGVERILTSPDLAKDMALKAYEKAIAMFDIDKNIGELESLLI